MSAGTLIFHRTVAIHEQIAVFDAVFKDELKLAQLSDISEHTEEQVSSVGRICCDAQGKLNEKSIMLEMSRDTAWRNRARLALDAIPKWSFFPGQTIAVEGTNSTGEQFDVARLLFVGLFSFFFFFWPDLCLMPAQRFR